MVVVRITHHASQTSKKTFLINECEALKFIFDRLFIALSEIFHLPEKILVQVSSFNNKANLRLKLLVLKTVLWGWFGNDVCSV